MLNLQKVHFGHKLKCLKILQLDFFFLWFWAACFSFFISAELTEADLSECWDSSEWGQCKRAENADKGEGARLLGRALWQQGEWDTEYCVYLWLSMTSRDWRDCPQVQQLLHALLLLGQGTCCWPTQPLYLFSQNWPFCRAPDNAHCECNFFL